MTPDTIAAVLALAGVFVTSLGAVVVSLLNHRRIAEIHVLMNSRMDELLTLTRASSHAEGVLEGKSGHAE